MTDYSITPPPELVQQWVSLACEYEGNETWIDLATQAARWGGDQELEACCEYISEQGKWFATPQFRLAELRAARRPKPPSLKEQALNELDSLENMGACNADTIRRALNQLPNE